MWVALPWVAPVLTLPKYDATMRDDVLPLASGSPATPATPRASRSSPRWRSCSAEAARRSSPGAGVLLAGLAAVWLHARRASRGCRWTLARRTWPGCASTSSASGCCSGCRSPALIAVARRSRAACARARRLARRLRRRLPAQPSTAAAFENGEFFRAPAPRLPAYVLLAASLPLLVPTLAARLGPLARPASVPRDSARGRVGHAARAGRAAARGSHSGRRASRSRSSSGAAPRG